MIDVDSTKIVKRDQKEKLTANNLSTKRIIHPFSVFFEIKLEDTFTRGEKYPSKPDISRSFIRIFEIKLEDTYTRRKKYPSKLDISRSFIRIFAEIHTPVAAGFQNR